MTTEHVVEDPAVGRVTLTLTPGRRVVVGGERVPAVVVERLGEREPDADVPVGTRDPADLAATLGGRPLVCTPRRGRLARGSYAVGLADDEGRGWVLTPASPYSSRLVRGTTRSRRHEVGLLTRGADGDVGAAWSSTLPPTPTEVALGYAVAAAFDTGAELTLLELLLNGGGGLG